MELARRSFERRIGVEARTQAFDLPLKDRLSAALLVLPRLVASGSHFLQPNVGIAAEG